MEAVQAVLPCKSVNDDGKNKILVNKAQYHTARDFLKDELPKWIKDDAAPDAKATLTNIQVPPNLLKSILIAFLAENICTWILASTLRSLWGPQYPRQVHPPRLSQYQEYTIRWIKNGRKSNHIVKSCTYVGQNCGRPQCTSIRTLRSGLSRHQPVNNC